MTILLPPDPVTMVATAYRWACRNDLDLARHYLSYLKPAELAEARMHLLRLALRVIPSMTPEGVAAAALAPDSLDLPDGVDGFGITGRAT